MRFNLKIKNKNVIQNHEGEKAFKMTAEMELYAAVVTTTLDNKFYEKADTRVNRIRELMKQVDPLFAAKLAVYAREKMYMRTIPLVMAVELAKMHNGDNLVSKMVARVVQRADEIPELLGYYQLSNKREGMKKLNKLSRQVQKGLGLAFNKFDEYQFAKYNRDGEIKLRDALFLIHPKPKSETQQAIFDKIVSDTLDKAYTWEVELSSAGQKSFETEEEKIEAFGQKWEEMIDSGKMGYMAMLRNLRNFLEKGVSDAHLDKVAARLADPKQVQRSKQFPFRFLSAYRELSKTGKFGSSGLMSGLEKAIQASVDNLRGFDRNTRVMIAVDMSGSMGTTISGNSTIHMFDVGLVLGMLLQAKCAKVITGIFGTTWKRIQLPQGNVLQNADALAKRNGEVGHATNGYLVIEDLIKSRTIVDKVMIFTDMQMWNSGSGNQSIAKLWPQYRKIAPNARLYLFDLAGYGQAPLQVEREGVFMIAGWSEKVFETMENIENGEKVLAEVFKIEI